MRNSLIHKAYNLFNLNGSVFCNLVTGDVDPDYGYMVYLKDNKLIVSDLDFNTVIDFTSKFRSKLSKGSRYISISREDEGCVLNICEVYPDLKNALFTSKQRNLNLWDNQKDEEISI